MPRRTGAKHNPLSRVFATTNQKGGVGKTTTAINLAASLAASDFRVLLVDNDPQGNATSGLGISKDLARPSMYHFLLAEALPRLNIIVATGFDGLSIIPADKNLAGANLELVDLPDRELRLRQRLAPIREKYDFVIIDCPPALDLLTLNALTGSRCGSCSYPVRILRARRNFRAYGHNRTNPRSL